MLYCTFSEVSLHNEFILLCISPADDQVVLTADEPVEALKPRSFAHNLCTTGQQQHTALQGGQRRYTYCVLACVVPSHSGGLLIQTEAWSCCVTCTVIIIH